jgi:hypothetical protein
LVAWFDVFIESRIQALVNAFLYHYNTGMEKITPKIGRPPKPPEELLVQRSIRLTAAQWEKIDAAGLPALRKLIDKWRVQPTQPPN